VGMQVEVRRPVVLVEDKQCTDYPSALRFKLKYYPQFSFTITATDLRENRFRIEGIGFHPRSDTSLGLSFRDPSGDEAFAFHL